MDDKAYELAEKDYVSGMKYKDIASKYQVSLNTVKSWKTRYKWSKAKKNKSMHTKEKVCTHNKRGAPLGNHNAVGNNGGAPPENKNAEKHGFFSKWLPEETMQIIGVIKLADPLDLLWDNIQLQYAAIIRAQKLMYVKDQRDITTTKIQEKNGDKVSEERWEVQQAWDKHATFLSAQSRAMKTFEGMLKQYDELLHKNWKLATDEQKARIEAIKAKANISDDDTVEDDGFIEALAGKVDEIWSEE